jgi:hypothetical protein
MLDRVQPLECCYSVGERDWRFIDLSAVSAECHGLVANTSLVQGFPGYSIHSRKIKSDWTFRGFPHFIQIKRQSFIAWPLPSASVLVHYSQLSYHLTLCTIDKSKVKLSRNRPWRPIGLWDVKDPTLSRQSAHRWRQGCQPYAVAALYSPETLLFLCFWYSFLLVAE